MNLAVDRRCPKCKRVTLHNYTADTDSDTIAFVCEICENILTTTLDPEKMKLPIIPNKIPQIDDSIQSIMRSCDKIEKPLFCGKEISAIYKHLVTITEKTRAQLIHFKIFPLFHADAFVRGDRVRDSSAVEKLNFTMSFCNLKITTFMKNKDVPADGDAFREKKEKALATEKEVRQKLLLLERATKDKAQSLESATKERIIKSRRERDAKFANLYSLLQKSSK